MKHFYIFAALICGFIGYAQLPQPPCFSRHDNDTLWANDGLDREVPRLRMMWPRCGDKSIRLVGIDWTHKGELVQLDTIGTYLAPYVKNTTMTAAMAAKMNNPSGTTAQYLRGNGTLATFPSIPTNTNQLVNGSGFITSEADGNPANEIQTLSRAGSTLSLSLGGGSVSLSTVLPATFSGVTNASGIYTVVYPVAYTTIPSVQFNFVTTDPRDVVMLISSSTTGFSAQVQRRVDVLGLLPTYTNRSGLTVYATVIPN